MFPLTLRIFCCRLSMPSAPLVKSSPTPSLLALSTTSRLDSEPPRRMGTGMLRTSQLRSACRHTNTEIKMNYVILKRNNQYSGPYRGELISQSPGNIFYFSPGDRLLSQTDMMLLKAVFAAEVHALFNNLFSPSPRVKETKLGKYSLLKSHFKSF